MPVIDGIVSGLDTTGIINAIVGAAEAPKLQLEQANAEYTRNKSAVAELRNRLGNLQTAIEDIWNAEDFETFGSRLGDESQVDVEVGNGAVPGTYSLQVNRTATSETQASVGFADKTAAGSVTSGSFDVTYNGETTSITVAASDTLEDIATSLNDVDGLTAYVLDTGEAVDPYKLVVQGENTGADYGITFSTTATSTDLGFTAAQTADDAWITVGGIDVYNNSNMFENVLPGVDITAKAVSASATDLTIEQDGSAMRDKLQGFVDAYNGAVSYYQAQTVYDQDRGIKGALVGDSSARRTIDKLGTVLSSTVSNAVGSSMAITSLSTIGIYTNKDGTLELDSETFDNMLSDNFESLRASLNGVTYQSDAVGTEFNTIGSGTFTLKATDVLHSVDTTGKTISELASEINALENLTARVIEDDGQYRLSIAPTDGIRENFLVESDGATMTEYSGTFGALSSLIEDSFLDANEGTLAIREDSLESTIKSNEERIADLDEYLDSYADRLRRQFTAMEQSLGKLQGAQGYISSIFASTPQQQS